MILIRHEYCPYISLVESYFDTIIWLKFDKKNCNHCKNIYIAFTYFPPYNSTFLKEHEVDLFTKYMSIGDIFIFDDPGVRFSKRRRLRRKLVRFTQIRQQVSRA